MNQITTALVVVDMQFGVLDGVHKRDDVIAKIGGAVSHARRSGIPVIWVQHSDEELITGSPAWQIVSELVVEGGESVIHKRYGDSFEETNLDLTLQNLNVNRIMVCGAQTDFCIRSTLHGAVSRGYDAILIADAHSTVDCTQSDPPVGAQHIIAHTNLYWNWHKTAQVSGGTINASDLMQ